MDPLVFVTLVAGSAVGAGLLGALFGLGGGIFLIPALTLVLHVSIKYAIGASLVSVIATSSGSAAACVRDRVTNIKIGTMLQLAAVAGALSGTLLRLILTPVLRVGAVGVYFALHGERRYALVSALILMLLLLGFVLGAAV